MSQGANPAESGSSDGDPERRMQATGDATSFLKYSLYSDALRTVEWEAATGVAYTGDGLAQILPVYGSVDAGQTTAVIGSYTDTITVSISY